MAIQDILTQIWVKNFGKKIDPEMHSWLIGPIGGTNIIKDQYIFDLAKNHDLSINENNSDAGLLETLESIGINNDKINSKVADFYLHTSRYSLDIKVKWNPFFLPFGILLKYLYSNRLQQLNLPVRKKDYSEGIDSKIIKLKSNKTRKDIWTIWYRITKKNQNVIFSGIYTHCKNPNYDQPLFKLIFPLPNGNASVIMESKVIENGSLLLSSNGNKFGESGFYFTLTDHKGNYWSKFVKSMHEELKIYEDDNKTLKAIHHFKIWSINFLTLYYSMQKEELI